MKMNLAYSLSAVLVAGLASAESVEFSADFDAETPGIAVTPTGFSAVGAAVDLIGSGPNGTLADELPGNGYYVDLAGDFGTTIETDQVFEAGTYELTFDLAGNNRQASADVVNVVLGDYSETITFEADEFESDFETFTFGFTTLEAGTLSFANDGAEGFGALLDNISLVGDVTDAGAAVGVDADPDDTGTGAPVTAVPTPAALPAGLLALGALVARRRRD